ncbi:hypothetical protein FOA52_003180 [Chlamydomonas sp. UWO 241]|nr:hypothetical protein FOA52_003180 [Chlamydomonas sp. UWO 241]
MLDATGNNRSYLDSVLVNGVWMTEFLQSSARKSPSVEVTLGCYAGVDVAKMTKAVTWPEHATVSCACSMQVGKAAKIGPANFIVAANGWGSPDLLSASAASVTALVAPHLEDGQLKGKVTFANVDLLHSRA